MQPAESKAQSSGNLSSGCSGSIKRGKRVSAGDLPDRIRKRIVDLMIFHECSDRAAEAAQRQYPSFRITGKTVSDVMLLEMRRPPVPASPSTHLVMAAGMDRRTA